MVRVDLHVHSSASFDCCVEPYFIVRRSRNLGLGPVCLTDHNTISAASAVHHSSPPGTVIVGEEILTKEGEIIGLFLQRGIAPGLTVQRTVSEIKSQGGIVYLPHPLDASRPSLSASAIDSVVRDLDVIEVFNRRSSPDSNRIAQELCRNLGAVPASGSDAHSLNEIGGTFVEMDRFTGAADFLTKLKGAAIVTRPHRVRLRIETTLHRLSRPSLRTGGPRTEAELPEAHWHRDSTRHRS